MLNHAIQTDVRDREMETSVQKRVMKALASFADEHGEVYRSISDIATKALACYRTTIRVLHELAALGEIQILNQQRTRGRYQINKLPDTEKPRVDSLRTQIAEAIRMFPLPVRVSAIFQALGMYASRSGNNIFPSVKTLMRDTGYSKFIIEETLRWLLRVGLIASDKDCINQKYQTRIGYKIPGWNANTQTLSITKEQIEQIKTLQHQRHNPSQQAEEWQATATEADDTDSTWLEEHSLDLEESAHNDNGLSWLEEDECEELIPDAAEHYPSLNDIQGDGKEVAPAAEGQEDVQPSEECEREEEGPTPLVFRPETHSEMFRIALRPQRKTVPITLKQYRAALEAIQPHLDIVDDHDSGRAPVDESTLRKSLAILTFYERTITLYEEQVQRE